MTAPPLPDGGPLSMNLAAVAGEAVISVLSESGPRMQAELTNSIRDYALGEIFGVGTVPDVPGVPPVPPSATLQPAPPAPATLPPIVIHLPATPQPAPVPDVIVGAERAQASARSRAIRSAVAGLVFALVPALWAVLGQLTALPGTKGAWVALLLVLVQTAFSTAAAYFGRLTKTPPYDKPLDAPPPAPDTATPPIVLFPSDTQFNIDGPLP